MKVQKELETTLQNLKIEKEKTEKTIQITQSFLIDQYNKIDQLNKEIYVAYDMLSILELQKNTRS